MADRSDEKSRFPQIPATVWWGVRSILNRTPNAVLDERFLAIQLSVQEVAAKQYISELMAVGILTDEKRATPLALEWRLDSSYSAAVEKILRTVYPQALLDLAPHEEGDRGKATSFFMREGLGQGAAGNKAATYFLIGASSPNDNPMRGIAQRENAGATANGEQKIKRASTVQQSKPGPAKPSSSVDQASRNVIPLNVNVQIHISADAGADQIEAIFSAMKRYLNDTQVS